MGIIIAIMATSKSGAPETSLTPMKKILLKALALVLVVTLTTAACGLVVLMDIEEKKLSITHSWFGQFWLKINRGNPILQPALFNLSVIGLFIIYQQFYPRSQAPA